MDLFAASTTEFGELLKQISERARSTNSTEITTYKSIGEQEVKLFAFPPTVACPFHQFIVHPRNCYVLVTATDQSCEIRDSPAFNVGKFVTPNRRMLNGSSGQDYSKFAALKSNSSISLKQATYISSLYAVACRQQSISLPDLWLLCGKENDTASLKKCTPIIKSLSVRDALKNKNVVHTAVDYHGATTTDPQSLKSVEDIVSRFKKKQNSSQVSTYVFSEYGLGSGEGLQDHAIILEHVYKNPEHMCCPPSSSAEVMVRISLIPGGSLSPVLFAYLELSSLLSLLKVSDGGSVWPESESPEGRGNNLIYCDSFIAKVKEANFSYNSVMDEIIASPSVANTIFPVRADVDFCDMLWLFVKDAQSLDELQSMMTKICEAVFAHMIQPIISTGNTAPLAKLLRRAIVCSDQEEEILLRAHLKDLLSKENVIQSLVELGLTKLSKDYTNYFTMHELVTKNHLNYYLHVDNTISFREKCNRLCKLHCIVELTACILHQLPMAKPSQLAQQGLMTYPSLKVDIDNYDKIPTPQFNIHLSAYSPAAKSTISLCSSLKPLTWLLLLNEEGKEIPSTMWLLKTQPLLGPDTMDTLNTTIEVNNTMYFMYQGHCDSTVL